MSVGTVVAQAPQAPASAVDRISGTWAGDIGLTDDTRFPVTFELKFDGSTAISGTVKGPGSATLKAGTFDRKTNALKLELDVSDDGKPTPFTFEGVAVNGVATGRVNGNGQTGTFKLARSTTDTNPASRPGADDIAVLLGKGFTEVSDWVTKSAALVPAEKYTYRPAPTVRTFGQLVAHVADSYHYYCGRAAGKDVKWTDTIAQGKTDKTTVVQKLKEATDVCTAAISSGADPGPIAAALGHTSLHYGNVITYLRMLGLVPPSSS
jgi:hypothetical protein